MANRGPLAGEEKWRAGILLLLMAALASPLIINYDFYFPFVVPRNIFFRVVVELAAAVAILFVLFEKKRVVLRGEWIFWSVFAFTAVEAVSATFSPARTHSFFGDFERMGGVWAWIHLALFLLLLRTLRDADWKRLLGMQVAISSLVSINTIAEHVRVSIANAGAVNVATDGSSTIGNTGLLAAYLLFGFGISAYLVATQKRFRIIYAVGAFCNLVAMVYAGNRSSVIGVVVGGIVGGTIYAAYATKSRRRLIAPIAAVSLAVVLIALSIVVRNAPGSRLASSIPEVIERLALTNPAGADAARTMQWTAALEGFRDRPLLGYGPENHDLVWSAHFNPAIYTDYTDVFDRTHNQFLEVLATTGILGGIAFLCIWVAIGHALVKAYRERRISLAGLSVFVGLQIAYTIYLFFWFFDLNSTMLWIVVAALIGMLANPLTMVRPVGVGERESRAVPWFGAVATAALLLILLDLEAYRPLRVAHALAVIDAAHDAAFTNVKDFDAAAATGGGQTAHSPFVLADYLGSLAPSYPEIREDLEERRTVNAAFQRAIESFRAEIHRDTLNDRLYAHEGALLMDAANFYQSDSLPRAAITVLRKAIELSPRRFRQRVELAEVYLYEHDTTAARNALMDAVKADPQLGEPRYRLAEIYLSKGKLDSAATFLQSSLRLGFVGSPESYLAVGKRLEFAGRGSEAAALYSAYLEGKYSKSVWEQNVPIERSVSAGNVAVAAHLPLVYARAQESELAIKSAAALALFDPSQAKTVDRFVSDVGSRKRRGWLARTSLLPCENSRARLARDSLSLGACAVLRRKL